MNKNNVGFDTLIGLGYVFVENVSAVTSLSTGSVRVEFSGENGWTELYFTPGGGKWTEVSDRSQRAGIVYKQELQVSCTKETQDEWDELQQLSTRKMLIKLIFGNGAKLLGSLNGPARFEVKTDSSGGLGIVLTVDRVSVDRARWITVEESGE